MKNEIFYEYESLEQSRKWKDIFVIKNKKSKHN